MIRLILFIAIIAAIFVGFNKIDFSNLTNSVKNTLNNEKTIKAVHNTRTINNQDIDAVNSDN